MIDVTVAELASALISVAEGQPHLNANGLYAPFRDGGGIWTIGRGHTAGVTAATPPATQAQVDQWFAEDQAYLLSIVSGLPILEAAALVSFGFNCGAGALRLVLCGHSILTHYVHDAKGNIEPGLVARRALESLLISLSQQLSVSS